MLEAARIRVQPRIAELITKGYGVTNTSYFVRGCPKEIKMETIKPKSRPPFLKYRYAAC
jgi:hypothetical protein